MADGSRPSSRLEVDDGDEKLQQLQPNHWILFDQLIKQQQNGQEDLLAFENDNNNSLEDLSFEENEHEDQINHSSQSR